MKIVRELETRGFSLRDVCAEDLDDFILVENLTHSKYVAEHKDFFGEYNEKVIVDGFEISKSCRRSQVFRLRL